MSVFLGSSSPLTRQRLRSRQWSRLSRDVYVAAGVPVDLRLRARAALLVMPDAVGCLTTAASLQRLPVGDDAVVHLARAPGAPRSRRDGVRVHRTTLADDEVLDLGAGLRVTDGPRTFCDLSALLDLEQLVAVGDVVVRRYGPDRLAAAVARHGHRRGVALARRALPLLDARADSPAETRGRLRLHDAGFVALRHGVVVLDRGGQWLAAPDLADEQARVAVQHDGLVHFRGSARQRRADVQRDELVREQDWQVVVATALDDARPELLVSKVTAAYLRAARTWGPDVLPAHLRRPGTP